ncbi:MAG: zinc metalloprotease [Flavobacteriales bacterium]|nr:zinc metalloprotease [Flavobacteriales bacterium]
MIKIILKIMFIIFVISANAQHKCGTEEIIKIRMKKYPQYEIEKNKVNLETEKWLNNYHLNSNTIITIPVVVHVVWETNDQNISDTQIQSQIDILNNDYRRTNIDQINTPSVWQSIASDCEIEFCLAKIDPNGNPTTGIERIQTTHGPFGMDSDIHTSAAGGADDWPNDDYLNIWVCDLGNNGILGYATPPSIWIGDGDGVVIGYNNFGNSGNGNAPYHKGRTATHEIGHWLNLEHLWGDNNCGDDQVNDTPKQATDNSGCPGFPVNENSCNTTNTNGDMFMNYMDYTNDACMNLFTNGQKARMLAAINLYRPNMLNHNICNSHTSILEKENDKKSLIKVIDLLGREIKSPKKHTTLFYIYNDGSIKKEFILK